MKYYIFKLAFRADSSGFYQSWHLTKPHEGIRDYDSIPPAMTLTYEGFDTFGDAENWINEHGGKSIEYTILPIIKKQ